MLSVKLLSLDIRRNGRKVTEVVIFASIGDGFQVFRIAPVSDAHTGDLASLCHIHSLLLLHNRIVGKLISGDPATLFHKSDDPLGIGIGLRDLIQCIFNEIMIFHFALPLSGVVFAHSKDGMQ